MGQTREQKIIRQISGTPTTQLRTPIATDMFLPNHSGISSFTEKKGLDVNQLRFTTTTDTDGNGLFMTGTYENTITTGNSASFLYLNLKNHAVDASNLYGLKMDLDTDKVDTGAGIAINNNGESDNIYLNVNGKAAGSNPTGIGIDINRNDYNHGGYGIQIWDFSTTDRGVFGPSGLYLRKNANTASQHRLLRLYGRKHLQTFELDDVTGTDKFLRAFDEPTGTDVFNIYTNGDLNTTGDISAAGYSVGASAGVDGSFTTTDGKTVTVTKGLITSIV